jgi:integrase
VLQTRLWQRSPWHPAGGPETIGTWESIKDEYRLYLSLVGRTPDTIENALAAVAVFERFCRAAHLDPLLASTNDLARFAEWLNRQKRASTTVRNRLVNLKGLYGFLVSRGYRPSNPLEGVKISRSPVDPIRPYTDAEIGRFFAAITTARDEALFCLLLATGWRASEVRKVKVSDIDWHTGEIRCRGKGRKLLVSAPSWRAIGALRRHMEAAGIKRGWVFPGEDGGPLHRHSLWDANRAIATRAGIAGANVHRWRHTFARLFVADGGSLLDLQILLGHSKVETTLRYLEYEARSRALRSQRLHNPVDRLPLSIGRFRRTRRNVQTG